MCDRAVIGVSVCVRQIQPLWCGALGGQAGRREVMGGWREEREQGDHHWSDSSSRWETAGWQWWRRHCHHIPIVTAILCFLHTFYSAKNAGVWSRWYSVYTHCTVWLELYTSTVNPYYSTEHWTHITAQARSGSQGIKSPCSSAAIKHTHVHTHYSPLPSPHHTPSVLQKLGYQIHQGLAGQPPQGCQAHVNQPADNVHISAYNTTQPRKRLHRYTQILSTSHYHFLWGWQLQSGFCSS